MREQLKKVIESTVSHRPMTHCITNPVTVNDCANIILAAGGTAIMAQDEREVEEITAHAQSLVLNMGAVRAQEAMLRAARTAKKLGHPVILDPVAAGASRLRGDMCARLLAEGLISVIRGNASEVRALAAGAGQESGVEADLHDQINEHNLAESAAWLCDFARRTGTVVQLTGAIDVITDGKRTAVLSGGSELLRRITGAGCMLTSLTGVYCGAVPDKLLEAAVTASEVMKHCGEQAEARVRKEMEGTASFRTRLIDAVSLLDAEEIASNARLHLL
ncbi:hydroxyethylthiazole kinase [Agathobaculum sp.]|uniref:hydroxyethylthiazole kinase n=1 Tax=Agathobaculum sp. TaxID=2048138 RepID=UPI003AF17B57